MKEYLEQRINELEKEWENTREKLSDTECLSMTSYYYYECQKINACIRELKEVLKKVEETE